MTKFLKCFSIILLAVLSLVLVSCNEEPKDKEPEFVHHDYAGEIKLDMSSETVKQEVDVRIFIDGDTTHFNCPTSICESGILKARYIAINTPESTGKIEEYGKAASKFTHSKLENATSIIVESDDSNWNHDSGGERLVVWVWYKTAADSDYRNLNIEILQNGLAVASNTANNRYGTIAMAALNQAKKEKLNIFSGEKDPDFYYGTAIELTLRELRCNIEAYTNKKVAFEGVVTRNFSETVYVEEYDPETDLYYGMQIYYGKSAAGSLISNLSLGNRVRVVGTVQYYEAGGTYQVSGLSYRQYKPNDPDNTVVISTGNKASYRLLDADRFVNDEVEINYLDEDGNEQVAEMSFAEACIYSTVSLENLYVKSIYTTQSASSSSNGAMTLTVQQGEVEFVIRTEVLLDANKDIITSDAYLHKYISVKGIIGIYDGKYQIRCFVAADIVVEE